MTGILGALKAIFSAFGAAFAFFKDRQLINAGKATEQRDALVKREEKIAAADAARADPSARERLRSRRLRD